MKAVVFHQHGPIDVLQEADLPTPAIGPADVLLDVKAVALNRLDLFVREGWPALKLPMPHILGADVAGVVSAVGSGVTSVKPGQRVTVNPTLSCGECEYCARGEDEMCVQFHLLGETTRGGYAEQMAIPARNLLALPDDISFEQAAAANLVMVTAWYSMIRKGNLRPGEDVLIVGAGGGVNSVSIQIAKMAGARVLVVASSADKAARAKALGADIVIDRAQTPDWSREVFKQTNRRGVDVVVDNVGQATWASSIRALGRGGRMLVVGNTSGYNIQLDSRFIFSRQLSIIGSTMGSQADFRAAMQAVFAHKVSAPIDRILPFGQESARELHRVLTAGDVFGKLVMTM